MPLIWVCVPPWVWLMQRLRRLWHRSLLLIISQRALGRVPPSSAGPAKDPPTPTEFCNHTPRSPAAPHCWALETNTLARLRQRKHPHPRPSLTYAWRASEWHLRQLRWHERWWWDAATRQVSRRSWGKRAESQSHALRGDQIEETVGFIAFMLVMPKSNPKQNHSSILLYKLCFHFFSQTT